jgi:TatD DNase family protein
MDQKKYIDAHMHLQDNRLAGVREEFISRALACGVEMMICNATCEDDWSYVAEVAEKFSVVRPFYGVHPWFSDRVEDGWLDRLANKLRHSGGIGEIGLDRLAKIDAKIQEQVFILQLDLAVQMQRSITIHCIKQWGRLLDILNNYDLADSGLLLHSFGGSKETMFRLLDLGALFSFSTALADPSKEKLRRVFLDVPQDRLLLETDAPDQYCPQLFGDKVIPEETKLNESAHVAKLYEFGARLRGLNLSLFQEIIWENGQIFTH